MQLSELGEFGFIESIRRAVGQPPDRVLLGIGDDTAVIDIPGPMVLLVSTDAMVEGRHFRSDWISPREIGHRAAAACMSDIAAMGGTLICLFATVSFPLQWTAEQATELAEGLNQAAGAFDSGLAGGDTTTTDNGLFVDVVAVGEVESDGIWLRDGARPGDLVFVTGTLGDSAGALALLAAQYPQARDEFPALFEALLSPTPRLAEIPALRRTGAVTACIDISDGLVQDAGHIAAASEVVIELSAPDLPVSEQLRGCGGALQRDPLMWAAAGGEDFELLMAVAQENAADIIAAAEETGTRMTQIGRVCEGTGVELRDEDGRTIQIDSGGWNHFRQINH